MISFRIWTIASLAILLGVTTGCAGRNSGQAPEGPPPIVKTLRPTFTSTPTKRPTLPATATPAKPTATPQPPAPTLPPPTEVPSPTPEKSQLSVNSGTVNVRAGPGTNYPRVGEASQGQTFEITGKNPSGDWWQFNFNGQPAWIFGAMVTANAAAANVQVAANIPAAPPPPPTARPAAPKPPAAPTSPPAPATQLRQVRNEYRNADDANFTIVTFWGQLGKTGDAQPITGGFKLRVAAPSGTIDVPFRDVWERAYSGQRGMEFNYNAKAELPRTSGEFRAVVIDGGGNEVSDAISGTVIDRTHDVILGWWNR